jgi:potassium efflux system protein
VPPPADWSPYHLRIPTITDLHKAINRKFEQAGIVISFPQRDLYLDTSAPLRIAIEDSRYVKPEKDGACSLQP